MTLESWAMAQAERLLAPLGDRWSHVQAVADKARAVAGVLPAEDADVLVAAALVHDVGYAPSLNRLGFHAVDGARFLRAQGQERLARLVAHHSGARFEAEERDLVEELAAFPVEDGRIMDALTFADMTTGPTGQATATATCSRRSWTTWPTASTGARAGPPGRPPRPVHAKAAVYLACTDAPVAALGQGKGPGR